MASIFTLPWADIGAGIKPADGALLNFYDTGTYNRRDTYTDAGAGTPHANPVVADANGVFPAIYLDGTYRVVLTDKNAVQYEEGNGVFSTSGDVAANTANIATNTADIATNVSDIAANTASISNLQASQGFIGLVPSNAADADHDITISAGSASDSTGAALLDLSAAITKQIDNAWAVGDNLGGLFTGAVAADTTYHLFIIEKTSDGTIDAGFDTSLTAANIPAGYGKYRRVYSFVTDSSANILGFKAFEQSGGGLAVDLTERISELSTTTPSTTGAALTIGTPAGLEVLANLAVELAESSSVFFLLTSTYQTNSTPGVAYMDLRTDANSTLSNGNFQRMTDTTSQVRYRTDAASVGRLQISLLGFIDYRV